jgi:hypothetical protein
MKFKIKNPAVGKIVFLIGTGFFLMQSLPTIAQQRIDLYYVRNEIIPTGNKLTYILASEIDSSQPKQLIVQRGGPIAILSLDDSIPLQSDIPTPPLTSYPSNGLIYIHAPYRVSTIRITDRNEDQVISEQKNIDSKVLKLNIGELKSGFSTLEIVSVAQGNSKEALHE